MTPGGVYIVSSNSSLTRSEFKTWPIFDTGGGTIESNFWSKAIMRDFLKLNLIMTRTG